MKLAVLGMGRMGQAVAARLIDSGHEVTVWNRTSGKAPKLLERGAAEAKSIAEAVSRVDVAISSLSNDDVVKEVALGKDGVRSAIRQDATYVDASTVAPATSKDLDDAFPRFVAMPILGAPPLVASGDAIYLIGAEDSAAEAVAPLFPALSEKRISYPRPSQAAVAKLTVNLMLLDSVVALAEAFGAGRAGGLSDDQLRELLGESPMVPPGIKSRFEGILTGRQDPLWTTLLGAKDARLALQIAESAGVKLPLTSAAQGLYEEAASRSQNADIAAVTELYR
jgi:3-hydroxyisobutyrate dehydrogenase